MQKLVIDTNIFISYLISKHGFAYKIINEIILGKQALHYISNETIKEYIEVSARTRFINKYTDFSTNAYSLLKDLTDLSISLKPAAIINLLKDKSDNKFLELAYTSNADYLITGNKLHFTFPKFYNTLSVSPREYWENYKP